MKFYLQGTPRDKKTLNLIYCDLVLRLGTLAFLLSSIATPLSLIHGLDGPLAELLFHLSSTRRSRTLPTFKL